MVRKGNKPFSKTDTMFFKKNMGDFPFHAFSQFARKRGGRLYTFSLLQEINPSVDPHFLAIAHFLTICEKVCGLPTHFLANCKKMCDCEKAWADNMQLSAKFIVVTTILVAHTTFLYLIPIVKLLLTH
jgi:hypothetical protein